MISVLRVINISGTLPGIPVRNIQTMNTGIVLLRSYLSKHLITRHAYDTVTARECVLSATRGVYQVPAYYEDESDDDTILDLLADADGTMYNQSFDEAVTL